MVASASETRATSSSPPPKAPTFFLPDFCASPAIFVVVLIAELVALVIALARQALHDNFWADLAGGSMFLLWIGLTCSAVLCRSRPWLQMMPPARAAMVAIGMLVATIGLVSEAVFQVGRVWGGDATDGSPGFFPHSHAGFVLRNIVVGFIVSALALRYFYVSAEWKRSIEQEALARIRALQARIRPHFLFNSMNTIASLTRSNPAVAEQAVQDLADLFRANLSDKRDTITLAEEYEVARTYQRIEELRLGPRLQVEWKIDSLPRKALVPGLMLQPLLENAIYHGIEPRPGGGTVTVTGEISGKLITIVVRNPVGDYESEREGNRLALANIRERLGLLYGERGLVKSGRFDTEYIVTLRFPHVEKLNEA